ncbi:MAG: pyridoxamine 5'-phosphate oxidase family protein [Litoreibacter sp.]|uniref:pyridoxamine 5'-phosphate oxidase family protein n=1 Tax=Litoreibacter sp. TaxID=1969459 RepID=UPI00329A6FE5
MFQPNGVFHEGERSLHEKLDIEERQHQLGLRMVRDHMPDQHREFFAMLHSVHIGAVDADGHPWAIMRAGSAGFMASPDDKTLEISSHPLAGEPEALNLTVGAKTSVVGIEFETQRRNRLNATVNATEDGKLSFHVDQSYGNCPKYIQIRHKTPAGKTIPKAPKSSTGLSPKDIEQITKADTLLIASRAAQLGDDPRAGVDINHRGGMPGFVSVLDDTTLQFPDYKGNSFYNTYGNILTDNRVGLQFVDFETGTLLNIKGTAELVEDINTGELPLMGRGLRINVQTVVRAEGALPYRYTFGEFSDRNPDITP